MKIRLTLKKTNKLTFCVDFIKQLFCMNLFNFSTNSLFTGKSKLIDLLLIIIWKKKEKGERKFTNMKNFNKELIFWVLQQTTSITNLQAVSINLCKILILVKHSKKTAEDRLLKQEINFFLMTKMRMHFQLILRKL